MTLYSSGQLDGLTKGEQKMKASNYNILRYVARFRWIALLLMALSASAAAQSGTYSSIAQYPLPTNFIYGIAAGPDGALWFTEPALNAIGRITTTGTITQYPVPTASSEPSKITVGPDGALWFTEVNVNQIGRITTAGDIVEYPVPTSMSLDLGGITGGPDGAVWFILNFSNKIGRITTGGVVTEYPALTENGGSITAGPDGALWFTVQDASKIGRITTAGALTEYPLPNDSSGPFGITMGPDGAMWITEVNTNKIGRITIGGGISGFTEYPVPSASGFNLGEITAGPDGALWFTLQLANEIGRITTTGTVTEYPVPTAGGPTGIVAGPDGALWFAEETSVGSPGVIGRAPACGLGFSASFSGTSLTMNFDLGIATPATFDVLFKSSAGVSIPFSRPIPAVVRPRPSTTTWNNIPNLGKVTVQPVLIDASGQAICSEWTQVNTAP
jgi:virginiamycin B lyase